jgi:anti-sigma factor (TIGR02949 family)
MDCKTAQDLIEAYLDGELDRETSREFEAHADACALCAVELTRLGELRHALRDSALRHTAPASLRARIRASAGETSLSSARALPAWTRIAAACVLAFGAGATSMYLWNSAAAARDDIAHDLFAGHSRALAAASPVDVISSDRHTVKPWFAGKVAQSPLVRDFADQGFALIGGRIDYVGSRIPVLVYKHGQHLIDVYVFTLGDANRVQEAAMLDGYRIEPVTLGAQPAAIVSDMDTKELRQFAQLLSSPSAP